MTPLFRSRQRAEDFAALVDGASPLREATSPGTERLVGVAQLLRDHGAADERAVPRDAFAADLRERLMAEAATVLTPQNAGLALPVRTRGKRERRLVAVASAAVLIGGTAGMATAAQDSLPGEALYPVKRGIEKAELGLSMSSAGRGHDLLRQASDRLDEAQGLVDQGSATGTPRVPDTVASFTTSARNGSDMLLASYAETRDPKTVAAVRAFTAAALAQVSALSQSAPVDAQPNLRDAAIALRDIDAQATRLCDTCSDLPVLRVPPTFLASAEVDRAMQRFQAAQPDNSHPVVAAKQDVRKAQAQQRGTASGSKQAPDGRASVNPVAPHAPEVSAAPTPGSPLAQLPGAGSTPKVQVTADVDVKKITDGLGDTVETILPDPGTGAGGLLP
jgi:Domain of unknown function (DUF5667)